MIYISCIYRQIIFKKVGKNEFQATEREADIVSISDGHAVEDEEGQIENRWVEKSEKDAFYTHRSPRGKENRNTQNGKLTLINYLYTQPS